ncbi:MAG TPA: bifunctional 4-hydroxy-2-oxoglutarate aldolase/2-dehydro-3-deoxy-phosphogluconate aldolase [Candidatus Kapabacteria bacterium]|nr:bifunctional 4-hydroxy-2-oxoglutarate aldolase/2-dehydro-3-deoxy-phosphogluconate aldolase [Candidatus Kapabacteria bacterium]
MGTERIRNLIFDQRLIAVVRLATSEGAEEIIDAIIEGGIHVIEITLTTPGAADLIAAYSGREGVTMGAGTVLTMGDAHMSLDAGAAFVASPATNVSIMNTAANGGAVTMPGAYTPTEILHAWNGGADIIKLFPAPPDTVSYLRAMRGPLPTIPLAPSGGITPETAPLLLQAGAAALHVGTWLTHTDGVVADPKTIARRAAQLHDAIVHAPGYSSTPIGA